MGLIVFIVLIALPITEIYVAVLVADQIGWSWTLLALLALSTLGFFVMRTSYRKARVFAGETAAMPVSQAAAMAPKSADLAMQAFAGFLLLAPGFVTGAIGLLMLIPPVRALIRVGVGNAVMRRYPSISTTITRVRIVRPGDVVPGQVVDPDDPHREPPSGTNGQGQLGS